MHADILGALKNINKSYKCFEHNGRRLSKDQVIKILKYGIKKGYITTSDFKEGEVDSILKQQIIQKNQISLI